MRMLALLIVVVSLELLLAEGLERNYHPENFQASFRNDAIDPAEFSADYWVAEAQNAINNRAQEDLNRFRTAKNVIMFLGDGMSVPTLAAARTLLGQRQGGTGEEAELAFETFPSIGLAKTYCVNMQIPDSACTATAYLGGVKNNYGTTGVTAAVARRDCIASANTSNHVESIAAWALQDGRDAGIVTNTRVTHASPSGAYTHIADRSWETDALVLSGGADPAICPDITDQLVNQFPGNQFKVIMGGGVRNFITTTTVDERGTAGRRTDNRNLINEWQTNKAADNIANSYVYTREQMLEAAERGDHILGLFASTHMNYNLLKTDDEPTLTEMTEAAIKTLSANERGYFLFVEGGRIDHAHHDNKVELALDEAIEFSNAVQRAIDLTNAEETLIVVTSDHAHVMAFNGYTSRGNNILGLSSYLGSDNVPYNTISYTNGPGFRAHQSEGVRADFTQDANYGGVEWRTTVEVPLSSETHGGDDVAVFARGPQQHMFTGLYEQSQIPHLMAYAACIGPNQHACERLSSDASATVFGPVVLIFAFVMARILQ